MKIHTVLKNLAVDEKNHVIAIGNFDGVHLGHRQLLETAKRIADQKGKKFGVLTFEPHPRRLFRPDESPSRLTPHAMKACLLYTSPSPRD